MISRCSVRFLLVSVASAILFVLFIALWMTWSSFLLQNSGEILVPESSLTSLTVSFGVAVVSLSSAFCFAGFLLALTDLPWAANLKNSLEGGLGYIALVTNALSIIGIVMMVYSHSNAKFPGDALDLDIFTFQPIELPGEFPDLYLGGCQLFRSKLLGLREFVETDYIGHPGEMAESFVLDSNDGFNSETVATPIQISKMESYMNAAVESIVYAFEYIHQNGDSDGTWSFQETLTGKPYNVPGIKRCLVNLREVLHYAFFPACSAECNPLPACQEDCSSLRQTCGSLLEWYEFDGSLSWVDSEGFAQKGSLDRLYSLATEFGLPEEVLPTAERVVASVFRFKCDASGGFGSGYNSDGHQQCSSPATDQTGSAQEICSWAGLDEYAAAAREHEDDVNRDIQMNKNAAIEVAANRSAAEDKYTKETGNWDRR
jgi:hypothetical protein